MGQITNPAPPPSIILTAVDRLVATNADGGLSPLASHVVLLGEDAGQNLGALTGVYVIGWNSLSGGLVNVASNGTVVYGANNLSALTNVNPPLATVAGPLVAIGNNIAPAVTGLLGSSVLIGGEIGNDAPALQSPFDTSVVVGFQALERQRTLNINGGNYCRRSVILGYRAARGGAFTLDGAGAGITDCVVIGAEAMENLGVNNAVPGAVFGSSIAIGRRALQNACSAVSHAISGVVAIGDNCATQFSSGQTNVFIGGGLATGSVDISDNVAIGGLASITHAAGLGSNIVLGARAAIAGVGGRCISIGAGANSTGVLAVGSDHLLIETVNSGTGVRRNLIYGNMGTLTGAVVTACGIVFGLSGAGSRDLPGMNVVKIVNGTWNGTNPGGGGLFYSLAGELHWVSTTGQDYAITPSASRGVFTVATLPLPAASVLGNTAFVTDALAPAFGAPVAAGGAVPVPVYFDGVAWNVG